MPSHQSRCSDGKCSSNHSFAAGVSLAATPIPERFTGGDAKALTADDYEALLPRNIVSKIN